jgi:hypothetical protein
MAQPRSWGKAPEYSLGLQVGNWIEQHCKIPDGPNMGTPYFLTSEMWWFLLWFYAVDRETERFVFPRGAQFVRPQKHGKGPFSAAIICAEAAGPVRLSHWVGDRPEGRPWETPWIQVTAVSEDQTDNVFRALLPMIQLSPTLNMEISDTGLTRVNLPGGGYIEPVTASARSRLGQRITFAVQDETHSWVDTNGGRKLADNQRRNLAGMGGRFLETTNAWDPVENSVAGMTATEPGVYHDDSEPEPGSVRNKRERQRVMRSVYKDSVTGDRSLVGRPPIQPWVDLERIDQEIEALLEHDPAQAERFFLNRKLASEGAAFDFERVKELVKPQQVPKFAQITLGVDGARHDDALAVIATDVKSGYQWAVDIIERPENAPEDYVHDKHRVDGAVREAFGRFNVWRAYCDPHHIADLIAGWQNEFGEKRLIEWPTYRPRPIAWAVREFTQAIERGEVAFDGNETFLRHLRQARRRKLTVLDDKERFMHTLSKDSVGSPRKIDAAMAAILSWEARRDCIAAGAHIGADVAPPAESEPQRWEPGNAIPAHLLVPSGESGPMGFMS